MGKTEKFIFQLLLGLIISCSIICVFWGIDYMPSGNDIYGHMYKTEFLADQLRMSNYYPLYSTDWYNGIQLYRYWPILTYYITGAITLITNDVFISYYIYLGITFFIGYFGWIMIAKREQKNLFVLIGIIWWFLPDNTRVLFSEGNLARALLTALLPLFLYFFTYLIEEKRYFIPSVLMIAIMTNTHFMIAAMCAIIFCIYGFFKGLKKNTWHLGVLSFICGFLVSALTLIPGIAGGVVSDGNSASVATMADWSQDLFKSLFYWNRNYTCLAFGLFALLAAIIVFCKNKGNRKGTLVAIVFFVLSDIMFIPLLIQLPLSQVWWMARFAPMCYALIFYEFGFVKPKRNFIALFLSAVFIVDMIPTYSSLTREDVSDLDYILFDKAVKMTDSRLGILDESLFGPYPSYAIYKKVPYLQGWAIQGASTKNNIVSTTESMKYGWYGYTFKNMLELGCDSIIINKGLLQSQYNEELIYWAKQYGYSLIEENNSVFLFDNDGIVSTYGTNFSYEGIAIGNSSEYMCYMYPQFKKGDSTNLDDYTLEELKSYGSIYLSNFQCGDIEETQKFLWELAESGTNIYIDSTYIPVNYLDIREFFGIEARFLNTKGCFDLKYKDAHCVLEFPYEWNATYLATSNENVELYSSDGVGFMAKVGNITLLGLNMPYVNIENRTDSLKEFFDVVFDTTSKAPDFEIVPVNYKYSKNTILVQADKPCVSTIAWQDNFQGEFEKTNNLLQITDKNTLITIYYKYFGIGVLISLSGLVISLIADFLLKRQKNEKKNTKTNSNSDVSSSSESSCD